MSSRSLNKVMLIGNLTRDPELRYTPSGAAVCTLGLATNRSWLTDSGEKKEETEFHRVVAWNKLAELCSQLLVKGRKIYVEGRLRTNQWQTNDGQQRSTTEIVIEDMIILDSKLRSPGSDDTVQIKKQHTENKQPQQIDNTQNIPVQTNSATSPGEEVNPDDIPF